MATMTPDMSHLTPRRIKVRLDLEGRHSSPAIETKPGHILMWVPPGDADDERLGPSVAHLFESLRDTTGWPLEGVELFGGDAPWQNAVVKACRSADVSVFINA